MAFRFLVICFLLLPSFSSIIGQGCVTIITSHCPQRSPDFDPEVTRGIIDFPVKLHLLQPKSGPVTPEGMILKALKQVNEKLIRSNIRLVPMDDIDLIQESSFFPFTKEKEKQLCERRDVPYAINLYITQEILFDGSPECGYTYYPTGQIEEKQNRIFIDAACLNKGNSLEKQFGHFFGLLDTYYQEKGGLTEEKVSRSPGERNCENTGDRICDTPADPVNSASKLANCQYKGAEKDAQGNAFRPNLNNIMSFGDCGKAFTAGQYAQMNYAALYWRNYLRFPTRALSTQKRLSGSLRLEVAGQQIPLEVDGNFFKSKNAYYSGTNYQVFLDNDEPAFLYVIASDLTKENYLLYPLQGQQAFQGEEAERLALPAKDQMFQMDETVGKDYLCILYSKKPLIIDGVMAEMEKEEGNFLQRLYNSLMEDIIPASQISYSFDKSLNFVANAGDDSIVPIIIEIEHK